MFHNDRGKGSRPWKFLFEGIGSFVQVWTKNSPDIVRKEVAFMQASPGFLASFVSEVLGFEEGLFVFGS